MVIRGLAEVGGIPEEAPRHLSPPLARTVPNLIAVLCPSSSPRLLAQPASERPRLALFPCSLVPRLLLLTPFLLNGLVHLHRCAMCIVLELVVANPTCGFGQRPHGPHCASFCSLPVHADPDRSRPGAPGLATEASGAVSADHGMHGGVVLELGPVHLRHGHVCYRLTIRILAEIVAPLARAASAGRRIP